MVSTNCSVARCATGCSRMCRSGLSCPVGSTRRPSSRRCRRRRRHPLGRSPSDSTTFGFDESVAAGMVATHLGTRHTQLIVSADDAMQSIPDLTTIYDEPFADSSQIPSILVSRLAREHVTVALSGDGGDEVFGGYNRHSWVPSVWAATGRVPLDPAPGCRCSGRAHPPFIRGRRGSKDERSPARAPTSEDRRRQGEKTGDRVASRQSSGDVLEPGSALESIRSGSWRQRRTAWDQCPPRLAEPRPCRSADVPRCDHLLAWRHPREGGSGEHVRRARGAYAVPGSSAGRVRLELAA